MTSVFYIYYFKKTPRKKTKTSLSSSNNKNNMTTPPPASSPLLRKSIVRCSGTWVYESTAFFSRKVEEKRVPAMLEFQFEHHAHHDPLDSETYGQTTSTSQIVLFNSTAVPPADSGRSENARKAVTKQREEATKCTIKFYELVNVHIVEDQISKYNPDDAMSLKPKKGARSGINNNNNNDENNTNNKDGNNNQNDDDEDEEGNSLATMGGTGSSSNHNELATEQKAVEDKSPLTLAITFCVRALGASPMKGTEDIFATPAERQDSNHPLRSIKFVITAIAATGGEKVAGGETPYKSMHDRFVDRVLHPVESFLLPEGKLHIFPIVSPVSGQGKGIKLYTEAQKIFRRSHHLVHSALITKYRGHAEDWMANSKDFFFPLDPSLPSSVPQPKTAARSIIVPFGGDGMIHEVVNGWFRRELHQQKKQSELTNQPTKYDLIDTPEAFDRRPFFLPFPTGSGCAVAAALGVLAPIDCAMSAIQCHWTACDSFVLRPTGPARSPIFPKEEVKPPQAADGQAMDPKNLAAGDTLLMPEEQDKNNNTADHHQAEVMRKTLENSKSDSNKTPVLPPSWDCMSWAKLKNEIPPPRIGLLSVSTGLISDVDKGSETMRYLGNARFAVEMVKKVAGSTPKYNVAVKYLPVMDPKDNKTAIADSLDSIKNKLKFANSGQNFPEPSIAKATVTPLHSQMTAELSFQPEKTYQGKSSSFVRAGSIRKERSDRIKSTATASGGGLLLENSVSGAAFKTDETSLSNIAMSKSITTDEDGVLPKNGSNSNPNSNAGSDDSSQKESTMASALLLKKPEEEKWSEFSSASDKDRTFIIMISNISAISRDCIFAPYARMNDGALDIVGVNSTLGKMDLMSVLLALEDGTHVEGDDAKNRIKYVKATEVEVDAKNGLVMCDGEIIPQCPLRVKSMPRSLKLVRTTLVNEEKK